MFGTAQKVYFFFEAHPKRQTALEKAIEEKAPTSKILKLKDVCRTRWIQRIEAVTSMIDLHTSIVHCFERMSEDGSEKWSPDSLVDARAFLLAITQSEFIVA